MNENKVPCGGFRIGDGLAMDGDTLKSLGGAYVKVSTNDDSETFEFMDDSPLKSFEEIRQKGETSVVTLLVCHPNELNNTFSLESASDDKIVFYKLFIIPNELGISRLSINSDNTITYTISIYLLTPAT